MMTVDQMIEVLTAYKAGKKIEVRKTGALKWHNTDLADWSFDINDYRVKPEPKVIWVNEHDNGVYFVHESKKQAEFYSGDASRAAVRYVEMPEEGAS